LLRGRLCAAPLPARACWRGAGPPGPGLALGPADQHRVRFARTSRGRHRRAQSTETLGPSPVFFRVVRTFSPADTVCLLGKHRRCGCGVGLSPLAPTFALQCSILRRARLGCLLADAGLQCCHTLRSSCRRHLAWQTDASPTQFVDTATPVRFCSLTAALARQAYSGCRGSPQPRRQGIHLPKPLRAL